MGRAGLLLLSALLSAAAPASSLDLIGCLLEDLCEYSERCFDDGAFGRCVSRVVEERDLRRLELSPDDLSELADLLELLVAQGHRWRHIYTQCILQTRLLTLQTGELHDGSACELVNDRPRLPPGSHSVPAIALDDHQHPAPQDSSNTARIRFSPPPDERTGKFYLPDTYLTGNEPEVRADDHRAPSDFDWITNDDAGHQSYGPYPSETLPAGAKRSSRPQVVGQGDEYVVAPPSQKQLLLLRRLIDRVEQLEEEEELEKELEEKEEEDPLTQLEENLAGAFGGPLPVRPDLLTALESREAELAAPSRRQAGLVLEPRELVVDYDDPLADYEEYEAEPIPLSVRSDPEFRRAERLDTKKPGPWFGVNNYTFDYDFDGKAPTDQEFQEMDRLPIEPMDEPMRPMEEAMSDLRAPSRYDPGDDAYLVDSESQRMDEVADDVTELPASLANPMSKKSSQAGDQQRREPAASEPTRRSDAESERFSNGRPARRTDSAGVGDGAYTCVRVRDALMNGEELVKQLESHLVLPRNTFDNIRVAGDQIMFRVNPNEQGFNSSTVAAKIRGLRSALESQLGIVIVEAGTCNESSGATAVAEGPGSTLLVQTLSIVLCALVAATVLVVLIIWGTRRIVNSRDKLKGLAKPDTEASRDYQELCRSRMAGRVTDKTDMSEKPQRVHSLSKESDGTASPTSRSSTSSWSEEPVVSNMDISTGHMVLSYMEDHLKKKDKLEEEWRALCAYEAEPSARTVASLPENATKNRRPGVLPYDHARVTLNAVTNATSSDYINASSITDHDPRNPAYIVTQGPLPHTANDFWQMVWEQGSVVIVMLTRLTESGAGMCHRYWPEEGSELYHIYEVHLVSEHIWCDEYLVRSFYLKNLKTSETRTVTQFHFLAWPDNSVPTSTKALLEFRRKVNKSYRGRSCPVILHCSDGAGRTGTYCLIDMVLNRMSKGAKEIDIAASLEHIRDQRATMVATRAQFEFVLMAVAEEVHAILKALPQ